MAEVAPKKAVTDLRPKVTMVKALNLALDEQLATDEDVVLLGEDIGHDGGVFRVTDGLLAKYGKERVIDTPLAELGILGAAFGMGVYGLKPIVEIQFMAFIYEAVEQVFSHITRTRSRSRGRFTCNMVIRTPYGLGIKGPELHSDSTEAIFCHMPGLKVVVPSSPYNAKGLLAAAVADPDPVLFMEPSRLYRGLKTEVPQGPYEVPLGRAEIVQEGGELTVIAWGSMLHKALEATEGFDAEVIDLLTLKPFDEETILASVRKTGRVVIVHEATGFCGLGAELSAFIGEHSILHLKAPVLRCTGPDAVVPMALLEEHYMPSVERIARRYKKAMEF
ncbi:Branched-chain alpha-keto acid dehydrogenase, E1 component, beta subunit [hydrothermal vent metagenome]|uniref:Branched-chain alpha-keto acid dehydrogenase, E1 component, beta subunit n=1 Tax=hydrothermal vent metagenome TaxID=652676 RepID=A0A3B0V8N3_9ZZZZ